MFNKWDIVYARMPYREDPSQSKTRPCVIVDVDYSSNEYLLIGITSSTHNRESDWAVKYCRQANISQGSVIMTDHIVRVKASANLTFAGRLDKYDKVNVMRLLKK